MSVDILLPTRVVDFYGDEIVAVEDSASGRVFVPLARLCDNLGIDRPSQLQRIQEHEVLQTGLVTLRLQTTGGVQEAQCLRLDLIPFWLAGINTRRVKGSVRPKLVLYQRECAAVLWDAFRPTGQPSSVASSGLVSTSSAAQAYEMAMAIATVARQQMQLEAQMTEIATSVIEQGRRLEMLEVTLAPKHAVSESQATELAQAIKVVARELAMVTRRNEYGGVYGQLYREFGITSYKSLPLDQFERAMEWLRDWYRSIQHGNTVPPSV
ncbi:MAG: hypothetical protein NVS2B7_13170 [Herpetosiphon sp.]